MRAAGATLRRLLCAYSLLFCLGSCKKINAPVFAILTHTVHTKTNLINIQTTSFSSVLLLDFYVAFVPSMSICQEFAVILSSPE